MSNSVTGLAGIYAQAWATHDADAIVALHTKDSVFHVHGLGKAAEGLTAVRLLVVTFFGLVPDLRFDSRRVYVGADHLVFECDMSGTTAGSAFSCDGVDIIAFIGGLVARKDTYLDLAALQSQIGQLPDLTYDGNAPAAPAEITGEVPSAP